VDDPFLRPDGSRHLVKPPRLFQGGAELAPKQAGERLNPDEEGVAGAQPGLTIADSPRRDEVMDVGMITQSRVQVCNTPRNQSGRRQSGGLGPVVAEPRRV
jgi:hypothetical protein